MLNKLFAASRRTVWPTHYHIMRREHIILCICQAMIAVVILQSVKLIGFFTLITGPPIFTFILLHLANMSVHLLLFCIVLLLLNRKANDAAKLLLPISFCSYILFACYLWRYNVNLQYYFLLSMFITCYVFDQHERIALYIAILIQFTLFICMQHNPPIHNISDTVKHKSGEVEYLHNIAYINTWVFGLSCVICALFIRKILSRNWQQLKKYEATQSLLLQKLFPAELVPKVLSSISAFEPRQSFMKNNDYPPSASNNMQQCLSLGVIFLDIVDFTEQLLTRSKDPCLHVLDWQSTYSLFAKFDAAVKHIDAKRIKTNGDQYILLIGLDTADTYSDIDKKALATIEACNALQESASLQVRIGAALGKVTCGVFDSNNPNFDIWGETVIRAARLEKLASPNQIIVDEQLYRLAGKQHGFTCNGKQTLKGLGKQCTYLLNKNMT